MKILTAAEAAAKIPDGATLALSGSCATAVVADRVLAAMEESCSMDVVMVKGAKNMLLGGEGIFNTVVRGPGKVILQTMPISKVAELLTPFFSNKK